MAHPPEYPGAPRWVRIAGAAAFIVFTGVAGSHGPGRHTRAGEVDSGNIDATAYLPVDQFLRIYAVEVKRGSQALLTFGARPATGGGSRSGRRSA